MDNFLEPPNTPVRPYHPHHCHDLALQKYLILYEQHESLRQHLDELRPTVASQSPICTPVSPSPAASPTSRRSVSRSPDDRSGNDLSPQRAFSLPVPNGGTYPDGNNLFRHYQYYHHSNRNINHHHHHHNNNNNSGSHDVALSPAELLAVEEAKLCGVNEGIKRTLTELLNCEAVRGDPAFRTWVQCRLMDTERELRSGRRRRSAPGA
ncbi:hypothetical protein VTH06DRAFT_4624 [Thermothelomyces fergusii]